MHRYLLYNEEVRDSHDRFLSPGQVGLLNGWGVFSTLRVLNGCLFAYERHWARMVRDAARMHVPMPPSSAELERQLLALVDANGSYNSTLRVAIVRNQGGMFETPGIDRPYDIIAFTRDLTKWGDSARLAWKPAARHGASEFAGAKILSWAQNLTWYEEARQRGYDEVVLLDEQGRVSECTSANIFAIDGDTVLTPPLDSGCLPGITREILLEAIELPGVRFREQHLSDADLEAADSLFITSSTREILPVREVEGLSTHIGSPLLPRLRDTFHAYMLEYARLCPTKVHPQAAKSV